MKKIVFAVCIVFALLSAALLITGFAMNANEPAFTDPVLVVSAEEAAGETVDETQPAEEGAEEAEDSSIGAKAIGAGIAVGLAAAAGAVGHGHRRRQDERSNGAPARSGGQDPFFSDARPRLHRDGDHLRPHRRHPHHLRPVTGGQLCCITSRQCRSNIDWQQILLHLLNFVILLCGAVSSFV